MSNLVELTTASFDDYIKSNKVVLVDFWAPWCGPCRMLTPTLELLSKNMANEDVAIYKVNTDIEDELSTKFNIRTIPTMLIYKNGELVDNLLGALPAEKIQNKLKFYLED